MLFISGEALAQKISISKMEMVNDRLVVHYKLEDPVPSNEYLVSIYSSKDNFSAPLTKVTGDVGEEVRPGDLRATWAIREEYGDYKGPLSVEVRASVFIPFVRLKTFLTSKSYKRGGTYPLEWRPGNTNPVHIELFHGHERLHGELNYPNSGTYTVKFPSRLKPGKGYRIKVTNSKVADDFVYSKEFKVKRKIPLIIKVLPLAAVGYVASTMLGGGEDNTGGGLPDPTPLPNK